MKKFIGLAGLVLAGMISVEAQAKPCRVDGDFCLYGDGDRVEYVNRSDLKVYTGNAVTYAKTGEIFLISGLTAPLWSMPLCENEKIMGQKSAKHLHDLLMADPNNQMIKVTFRAASMSGKGAIVHLDNRYGSLATQMIMDNQAIETIDGLDGKEARRINWCGGLD